YVFHHQFDGFFQLWVLAFHEQVWAVLNYHVRLHAFVFDDPFAVEVVAGKLRTSDVTAVNQRNRATDTAYPTPGTFADEWSELVILEVVAEQVAVRRGIVIGNAGHGTIEDIRRNCKAFKIAGRTHAGQNSTQTLKDKRVNEAAAVVTNVNDHAFFA